MTSSCRRGSASMAALTLAKASRSAQAEHHRRIGVAPERRHHLLRIAPDLAVEAGLARVEHAHHQPVALGKAQRLTQPRAAKAAGDRAPGDDLRGAGAKHAALDDLHLRPQLQPQRRGAAHGHVAGLAVAALGQVVQHHRLLADQALPRAVGGDAVQAFDDRRLAARDAAVDLGPRALAQQQQVVGSGRWPPAWRGCPRSSSAPWRTRTPPAPCRRRSAGWSRGAPTGCARCRTSGMAFM